MWFTNLLGLPEDWTLVHEHRDHEHDDRKVRESRQIDIISRTVCRGCNSGWLSDLEKQAKSVLTPLLLDAPTTLTRAHMDIVALWATKTAIMSALAAPRMQQVITPVMPDWVFRTRVPLPHSGVWLGRYLGKVGGPQAVNLIPRALIAASNIGGRDYTIYDWTAVLGRLVFKVVILPTSWWNLEGAIEFSEPKPLIPIHANPRISTAEWPLEGGYVEPEVIALSYALCRLRVRLDPPVVSSI